MSTNQLASKTLGQRNSLCARVEASVNLNVRTDTQTCEASDRKKFVRKSKPLIKAVVYTTYFSFALGTYIYIYNFIYKEPDDRVMGARIRR